MRSIESVGAIRENVPRESLAEARIDLALHAWRKKRAELKLRAPAHRVTGDDVLSHRMLHEALWRVDVRSSGSHVRVAGHAFDAAEVIRVTVAVDDGSDGLARTMLEVEFEGGMRCFDRKQWIDDDDAGRALDDRHVGDVESAYLVDARCS